MSRTSRVLAAAAIAVASAVAVTAASAAKAAAPARTTAPAPHWRIVAAFPKQSSVDYLAASSQASAWAAESCRKPCASGNGVVLRHWNGKTWQVLPQPANAKHTGNAVPMLAASPGSRYAWAVDNIYDHKTRASVAEWTGKSWAHPTVFPVGTNFQGLAAVGPSGLWLFGSRQEFVTTSYVVSYNGESWVREPSPGTSVFPWTAAAGSASGIWAEGIASQSIRLAVSHWTGTRWVAQAVPPKPKGAQGVTGGLGGDLAVSGKDSVWGFGYFAFGTTASAANPSTLWLVHWNGKAWANVRVPYSLNESFAAGPIGSDGHGGAWLAAAPAGTTREYLYHVSAAGRWTRVPILALKGAAGTSIAGFAAIPGTSSVYAYGWSGGGATQRGVILKYGA